MLENVSVLIPFKTDSGPRQRAFEWVLRFYEKHFPGIQLCVGESDSTPFNKSEAVNKASRQATGDIFVIADADIVCDPHLIVESVHHLRHHPWVIPYNFLIKLSEKDTQALILSEAAWPLSADMTSSETLDARAWVGALNIVPKEHFYKVGGFDKRFAGWGREDDAFSFALDTLCGRHHRLNASIYHLWHPFVGTTGNPNIAANTELWWVYRNAYGNPDAMQKIIDERDW